MKRSLQKKQRVDYFDPQAVLYLTGDGNYSWVHLAGGQVVLSARTLKWFAQLWPDFLRPHKRALVNPTYVHELQVAPSLQLPSYVVMRNEAQLPISRRRISGMVLQIGKA